MTDFDYGGIGHAQSRAFGKQPVGDLASVGRTLAGGPSEFGNRSMTVATAVFDDLHSRG